MSAGFIPEHTRVFWYFFLAKGVKLIDGVGAGVFHLCLENLTFFKKRVDKNYQKVLA